MMKRKVGWLLAGVAALALQLAAALPVSAAQHYGGYASASPDSSTCGNDWANDTFVRHFTLLSDAGGVLTVVEDFKDGSFVTVAGPSPGGCDTNPGGTVVAGVTGSLHGYFVIPMAGETQTTTDTSCVAFQPLAPCTTAGFINSHFTPSCYPNVCQVTSFLFHYVAAGQGLAFNEWKNASADRGGNSGDIAST